MCSKSMDGELDAVWTPKDAAPRSLKTLHFLGGSAGFHLVTMNNAAFGEQRTL